MTRMNLTPVAATLSMAAHNADKARNLSAQLRNAVKVNVPRSMLKSASKRKEVRSMIQSLMGFTPAQIAAHIKSNPRTKMAARERLYSEALRRWNIARVLLNRAMDEVCKVKAPKARKVTVAQQLANKYTVHQLTQALKLARSL